MASIKLNRNRRRGVAATEMALLLPFLVLLFAIILDFARVYYVTQTLDNSVMAGAMYASGAAWTPSTSVSTTTATAAACAEGASLSPPLQSSNVTIVQNAATVTVTISYSCELITPFFNGSQTLPLTRTVTLNMVPVAGS